MIETLQFKTSGNNSCTQSLNTIWQPISKRTEIQCLKLGAHPKPSKWVVWVGTRQSSNFLITPDIVRLNGLLLQFYTIEIIITTWNGPQKWWERMSQRHSWCKISAETIISLDCNTLTSVGSLSVVMTRSWGLLKYYHGSEKISKKKTLSSS